MRITSYPGIKQKRDPEIIHCNILNASCGTEVTYNINNMKGLMVLNQHRLTEFWQFAQIVWTGRSPNLTGASGLGWG